MFGNFLGIHGTESPVMLLCVWLVLFKLLGYCCLYLAFLAIRAPIHKDYPCHLV